MPFTQFLFYFLTLASKASFCMCFLTFNVTILTVVDEPIMISFLAKIIDGSHEISNLIEFLKEGTKFENVIYSIFKVNVY